MVNEYWKEKIEENESFRFSSQSKEAFRFLRKVYKYHEYQRRDGAIIDRVLEANGEVVTDEDQVHVRILEALKELQVKNDEPTYEKLEPFSAMDPQRRGNAGYPKSIIN